ncbi:MAG: PAS domain S-box protein [Anaerolineae bacterium]|nr:PAS domain S-box protein [Anaerolineae bacterium]NUQ06215.1 PAS domain S-box protein [Anaerolineae bacterium]
MIERRQVQPHLRTTLLYTAVASLWILLSDAILFTLFGGVFQDIPELSILKGLGFVVVTSLLLFFRLRHEFKQQMRQEADLQAEIRKSRAYQAGLQASETRFRRAVEEAPLPILIFADDGEILSVSRAWLEITGYHADQLTTLEQWLTLAYGDRRQQVQAVINDLFSLDHRVDEGEFTLTCADGSERIWAFSSTPLGRLSDGRQVVISIATDVTEDKRIRDELHHSNQFLQTLVKSSPLGIIVTTPAGIVQIWNSAMERISGWTEAEAVGRFLPILRDQDPGQFESVLKRLAAGETVTSLEAERGHHDGSTIYISLSASPLYDPSGAYVGIVGIVKEIGERIRAEAALRESEERFRQLAENIHEVFYLNDAQKQQILYISPAYEQIWGRSRESLYQDSHSFVEPIHPDDRPAVIASFEQQRQGHTVDITYRLVHPDGKIRWVRSRAFPVIMDGQLRRIAGIAEDITALRETETNLKRLTEQMADVQEAERREIAHELHDEIGQTLTGLSLSLEMLRRDHFADDSEEIAVIQEIVQGLMRRVREISLDLRPAMLDDLGLLPALRWLFRRYTERTSIAVQFQASNVEQRFDRRLETAIYRIVQEALTNAARYAGVQEVIVNLWANERQIIALIEDHGRGFDVEKQRAEAMTAGLMGMRERAHRLGGQFLLDSTVGKGTQIIADFPLEPFASDRRAASAISAPVSEGDGS